MDQKAHCKGVRDYEEKHRTLLELDMSLVNKVIYLYLQHTQKSVKFIHFISGAVKFLSFSLVSALEGFISKETFISCQKMCPLYRVSTL